MGPCRCTGRRATRHLAQEFSEVHHGLTKAMQFSLFPLW